MKSIYTIVCCLLCIANASAQISGRVIDTETSENLPFVNIVYNSKHEGLATNIDGKFSIPENATIEFISFSYVGYKPFTIDLNDIDAQQPLTVRLTKLTHEIEAVTVFPGENPAHRIINEVLAHRDQNNPEKLESFAYTSYNKMFFMLDEATMQHFDSLLSQNPDSTAIDTSFSKMKNFTDEQFFFLTESVTRRFYEHPGKNKETVLASRVSGFRNPAFTMLATQFQSFTFYDELLTVGDKLYINPISTGSTRRYFFLPEDTTYTPQGDSVFVISFRPRKNKNFDALRGVLNINTNGYAIESVIAEPAEADDMFSIIIKQKYEQIEGRQWFPVELDTRIIFSSMVATSGGVTVPLAGIGKGYIRDIELNPDVSDVDFGHIALDYHRAANRQDEAFWEQHRPDSLTIKEQNTYQKLDSLGEEHHFEEKFFLIETLVKGHVPIGIFNIDLNRMVDYNQYEKLRLGAGVATNERFSRWFSVGGYGAYGFGDKAWKYGGFSEIVLRRKSETSLQFTHIHDVSETGSYEFFNPMNNLLSNELIRSLLIENMYIFTSNEVSLHTRLLDYWLLKGFYRQTEKTTALDYAFRQTENAENWQSIFRYETVGLQFRFVFREKYMQTPTAKIPMGSDFPVWFGNIEHSFAGNYGEMEFWKFESRVSQTFHFKLLGKSNFQLTAGYVSRAVPAYDLYNGHGSYDKFSLYAPGSFTTMRLNEFWANRFVSVFWRHNFGTFLPHNDVFNPKIEIATGIGWGDNTVTNMLQHRNLPMQSFAKGYAESGIVLHNLLNQLGVLEYGVGAFYRYGAYQRSDFWQNIAIQLSFRTAFD